MMIDDEFRSQLADAAEEFPVRGWPLDVHQRVVRRRRVTTGVASAVAVLAAAAVVAVFAQVSAPKPDHTVAPPPTTVSAAYIGSRWRLTSVADGTKTTAIPAELGAWMDLRPDGRILIDDGENGLGGWFTSTADGFEVRDVTTTYAIGPNDLFRQTAVAAFRALTNGDGSGVTPVRSAVLGADESRLVVQSSALRLTFERAGPAGAPWPKPS